MSPAPTAVIMAGGKGHRMHPFTQAMPKALLPVGSSILLDILVAQMHRAGCREVVVSLGHLAPVIRAYCAAHPSLRLPVRLVEEGSPLGTAGAIGLIEPTPRSVVVVNCDVLSDVSYGDMIREHEARGADLTILGVVYRHRPPYGVLELDGHGLLAAWHEGTEQQHVVAGGVYVVGERALSLVRRDERLDMPALVSRVMAAGGAVHVFTHGAAWFDLGTLETYALGVAAFMSDPARFGVLPGDRSEPSNGRRASAQ